MRDTEKTEETDFLNQVSFQLAQPYVKYRKLTGETKLLGKKTGFIKATLNTLHQTQKILQMRKAYAMCRCH